MLQKVIYGAFFQAPSWQFFYRFDFRVDSACHQFFHVGSGGLIFSQTSPAITHGTSLLLVQFFFGSTDVPRTQRIQEIAQVVRNVLTVLTSRYSPFWVWNGMGRYGAVWGGRGWYGDGMGTVWGRYGDGMGKVWGRYGEGMGTVWGVVWGGYGQYTGNASGWDNGMRVIKFTNDNYGLYLSLHNTTDSTVTLMFFTKNNEKWMTMSLYSTLQFPLKLHFSQIPSGQKSTSENFSTLETYKKLCVTFVTSGNWTYKCLQIKKWHYSMPHPAPASGPLSPSCKDGKNTERLDQLHSNAEWVAPTRWSPTPTYTPHQHRLLSEVNQNKHGDIWGFKWLQHKPFPNFSPYCPRNCNDPRLARSRISRLSRRTLLLLRCYITTKASAS